MKLEKYHGIGNDFLITDDESLLENNNLKSIIIKACDRHFGFGADGFIIVKRNPLEMVFYNQDGSRGEMCGNGIRCFSYYCYLHNIINEKEFDVVTLDGIKHIEITSIDPFICKVKMGSMDADIDEVHTCYEKSCYKLYSLNFGVPHAVIFSDELNNEHLGKYLEQCELFPNHANIDFMMIKNNQIYMHTYERGVGFTLACGTGACSCFVVSRKLELIEDNVIVNLPGGKLTIYTKDDFIYMEGPAEKVGMVEIEC